ncbi:hypothetical protein SAV14893_094150 [Streptomyces avermitilis]|uniref:Uncharacterized protein n=1 Tax=Streptomyces avermitilis TaxID=33903 RepID=A0A4D4MDI3_STRAX|nr:hypothetical protein SAV14893_094150 [Streptomyces avermitilis]
MPAAFESWEAFFEVGCLDGPVVLSCDALVGKVVEDGFAVRAGGAGAVGGPSVVDPEFEEVAGERFGFDGVIFAVVYAALGEVGG